MSSASYVPSSSDAIRNARGVMKHLYFGQACFSQVRWGKSVDIGSTGALTEELAAGDCDTWVDLKLQCRSGAEPVTVRLDGLQRMSPREPGGQDGVRLYYVVPGTKVSEKRDLGAIALRMALLKHLGVQVLELVPLQVNKDFRRGHEGHALSSLVKIPNPAFYDVAAKAAAWQREHQLLGGAPACSDSGFAACLRASIEAVGPEEVEEESDEVAPPKPVAEWTGDDLLYGYALWGKTGAMAPAARWSRLVDLADAEVTRYCPGHQLQVAAAKQAAAGGDPALQWTAKGRTELSNWVACMVEPLYCLDLENYSTLIPLWEGVGPNEPVPFQYSLHVLSGAEVTHSAFLHREDNDPRWAFVEQLLRDVPLHQVGQPGTLLVYSTHEKQTLTKMLEGLLAVVKPTAEQAAVLAGFKAWLQVVFPPSGSGRHLDLMLPFFKNHKDGFDAWIYHPLQGNSASIKAVHPALCGCTSPYASLQIQDGLAATAAYLQAVFGGVSDDGKQQIFENLLDYCEVDSRVMVQLAGKLRELG